MKLLGLGKLAEAAPEGSKIISCDSCRLFHDTLTAELELVTRSDDGDGCIRSIALDYKQQMSCSMTAAAMGLSSLE